MCFERMSSFYVMICYFQIQLFRPTTWDTFYSLISLRFNWVLQFHLHYILIELYLPAVLGMINPFLFVQQALLSALCSGLCISKLSKAKYFSTTSFEYLVMTLAWLCFLPFSFLYGTTSTTRSH